MQIYFDPVTRKMPLCHRYQTAEDNAFSLVHNYNNIIMIHTDAALALADRANGHATCYFGQVSDDIKHMYTTCLVYTRTQEDPWNNE